MAGRRRFNALASAADLASQILLSRQEHDRELRKLAIQLVGKFAMDQQLEEQRYKHDLEIKRLELGFPDSGGQPGAFGNQSLIEQLLTSGGTIRPGVKVSGKIGGATVEVGGEKDLNALEQQRLDDLKEIKRRRDLPLSQKVLEALSGRSEGALSRGTVPVNAQDPADPIVAVRNHRSTGRQQGLTQSGKIVELQ